MCWIDTQQERENNIGFNLKFVFVYAYVSVCDYVYICTSV